MAQPIGGFMHYALTSGHYQMLRHQVNLIIDVGFVTLDWLLCDGMRPIAQRSGHTEGGVSAILRPIAQHVSQDHDVNFTDFTALDRGLREGYFNLFGGQIPIFRYLPDAAPVLDKAVAALCHSAGDGSDINNIFLVGSGAKLYASAIATRFPKHPVVIVDDPVYANVRGFQLAGERQMKEKDRSGFILSLSHRYFDIYSSTMHLLCSISLESVDCTLRQLVHTFHQK